ncbi:MAG TPA: hypothetical protein VG943_12005 [Caulobacterales bacterium]|nr:hypothetical protein [Caulobacterales bacterium]
MKALWAAAMAAGMLVGGVAHADDAMQTAYGNTVVVTEPNGAVLRYYFEPDGTFTASAPNDVTLRGRYEVAGDQLCFLAPSGQRTCSPLAAGKHVGDSWTQTGTQGQDITVTLQAGRP